MRGPLTIAKENRIRKSELFSKKGKKNKQKTIRLANSRNYEQKGTKQGG